MLGKARQYGHGGLTYWKVSKFWAIQKPCSPECDHIRLPYTSQTSFYTQIRMKGRLWFGPLLFYLILHYVMVLVILWR